jgi:hypothetical protein
MVMADDELNYDALAASVARRAAGGAKAALKIETGYEAFEVETVRRADGTTVWLSTPGSKWKITIERERTS